MPDTLKTSLDIWVFGTKKVFKLYDCGLALDAFQYSHAGGAPEQQQKNQIVLHCTAGFGPGRGSVDWWNTLHQGASVSLARAPSMAATMLVGMLIMSLAAWMYAIAASLYRVRSVILEREAHADWVRQLPEASA